MASRTANETAPIIIKKYANRRLYNTDASAYVTLDDLRVLVARRAYCLSCRTPKLAKI